MRGKERGAAKTAPLFCVLLFLPCRNPKIPGETVRFADLLLLQCAAAAHHILHAQIRVQDLLAQADRFGRDLD